MCLNDLKLRIDASAYVVDPRLVAEALLRRGDAALWLELDPPILSARASTIDQRIQAQPNRCS